MIADILNCVFKADRFISSASSDQPVMCPEHCTEEKAEAAPRLRGTCSLTGRCVRATVGRAGAGVRPAVWPCCVLDVLVVLQMRAFGEILPEAEAERDSDLEGLPKGLGEEPKPAARGGRNRIFPRTQSEPVTRPNEHEEPGSLSAWKLGAGSRGAEPENAEGPCGIREGDELAGRIPPLEPRSQGWGDTEKPNVSSGCGSHRGPDLPGEPHGCTSAREPVWRRHGAVFWTSPGVVAGELPGMLWASSLKGKSPHTAAPRDERD